MHRVTYEMGTTLDGYVVGPDGSFDWGDPSAEVFQHHLDALRGLSTHLMGRRLHEAMLYWESAEEEASWGAAELEWAHLWRQLPKVVFSTTLTEVEGTNTRLATRGLAEEIEALRAAPGGGDIAIGGATLAAEAAALDLIDEYLPMVHPVLVGGGLPFFPQAQGPRVQLELVARRDFPSGVVHHRYRVVR